MEWNRILGAALLEQRHIGTPQRGVRARGETLSLARIPLPRMGSLLRTLIVILGLLGVAAVQPARALINVGALDTPGYAFDVKVIGGLAYVADGGSGLRIIDFGPEYRTTLDGCWSVHTQWLAPPLSQDFPLVASMLTGKIGTLDWNSGQAGGYLWTNGNAVLMTVDTPWIELFYGNWAGTPSMSGIMRNRNSGNRGTWSAWAGCFAVGE